MIYLLLGLGGGLILFGLYRFFVTADRRQVRALLLAMAGVGIAFAALWLAVTGRLPAAMTILIALWPILSAWLQHRATAGDNRTATQNSGFSGMTTREAYEILGLDQGAGAEDVKAAYIRLMKKVHPDQEGSDWLAQKINAAKDLLLNERK